MAILGYVVSVFLPIFYSPTDRMHSDVRIINLDGRTAIKLVADGGESHALVTGATDIMLRLDVVARLQSQNVWFFCIEYQCRPQSSARSMSSCAACGACIRGSIHGPNSSSPFADRYRRKQFDKVIGLRSFVDTTSVC